MNRKDILGELNRIGSALDSLYDDSAQAPASAENDILYRLIPQIDRLLAMVKALAQEPAPEPLGGKP